MLALPAHAADLTVTNGTLEVNAPGDITQDRVVVDNSGDADAALKINSGVTFSKVIILNNDGSLVNEGIIFQTGAANNGAFGDVGLARVTNRAGGTITVDDIGMWLKADGTVLNTGTGTSINGRIGISINNVADVTNELEAEINAGTGAGLYLNSGKVINRSGASIISNDAEGIRLSGAGDVTNTGENSIIDGGNGGVIILSEGSSLINEEGARIEGGTGRGVLLDGGTVINRSGATISGDMQGVAIWGEGSSLINEGGATIHGGTRGAIVYGDITNRGAGSKISSDADGIRVEGGATVRNEGGAEIVAEYLAVNMYDGGDVYNTGGSKITSNTTDGIDVWIYGSVTNSGEGSAIKAGGYAGVYFNPFDAEDATFTLTNSDKATIEGHSFGISLDGAAGLVTNEGGASIASVAGSGIDMNYSGNITNRSGGMISGPVTGLHLRNDDDSYTFTVINTGAGSSITGLGIDGIIENADGIFLTGATSSVTNADGATISGQRFGTWLSDGGSFTNEGEDTLIEGGGSAIYFTGVASLTNRNGAEIAGGDYGVRISTGGLLTNGAGSDISGNLGVLSEASTLELNNAGSITGKVSAGVKSAGAATITNSDAGEIAGVTIGVEMRGGGTLTNKTGASIGGATGVLSQGSATTITNSDESEINGVTVGVDLKSGGALTNESGAAIAASDANGIGARLSGGGTLINKSGATISGTLRGAQGWGAVITNTGSQSAITSAGTALQTWSGGGSVSNAAGAIMHGGENGVLLDVSTAIENIGGATITGDTGKGVLSYNGGTVTNTGAGSRIQGGSTGIQLLGGTGTVSNTDGAEIAGGSSAISLHQGGSVTNGAGATLTGDSYGIYVEGGAASVSNAGTIEGDVSLAGGFDNVVTLFTGSSIDGNLAINNRIGSTLTFDGAGMQLLSDVVTGTVTFGGVLTKQGAGTWVIDKNLQADTTNVTSGGLVVGLGGAGTLTSDVNVSLGATLAGSGNIIGNVVVDGTVMPGNSPGVLNIVGDYTQSAGSTFNAEIDTDSGLYDQIIASGTATIAPGAVLNVSRVGGTPYVVGTQYVFLDAASGVTGSYIVTGDLVISPFLSLTDHYAPGQGYLQVEQTLSLADIVPATSGNQVTLADAIQSATTSDILTVLVNQSDVTVVSAALPQLTGEIYPSMAGAMLEDSRYIRNAAIDRLQDRRCDDETGQKSDNASGCGSNPTRFWSTAFGAWARDNSADNVASMHRTTGGMLFGLDTTYSDFWRAGLMTGYGVTHFEMNDRRSSTTSDDYHLGFYVGTLPGQAAVKLGALRTWHHVSTSRSVNFVGLYNHLEADYHAATTQIFAEAGYRLAATMDRVQPFANVTYADNRTPDFSESGGAAALTQRGGNNGVMLTTIGLHLNDVFTVGASTVVAKGTLGWRNASGDTTPGSDFEIGGSTAYRIEGLPMARNALVARTDMEMTVSDKVIFGLTGDGQFAHDKLALGVQARLTVNF